MRCLYCGKELALLKRWTSGGEFCSDAHRQQYQEEYNQLALNRLLQAKVEVKPPPEAKPEPKPEAKTQAPPPALEPPKPAQKPLLQAPEPEPVAPKIEEEPAPAEAGLFIELPVPVMADATRVAVAETDFVRGGRPVLPSFVCEPRENWSTEPAAAGQVTIVPSVHVMDCAARVMEGKLELREFVRAAPVVEIDLRSATGIAEKSEDPMDILIFPQPPSASATFWNAAELDFTFTTETEALARMAFRTTGVEDNESGEVSSPITATPLAEAVPMPVEAPIERTEEPAAPAIPVRLVNEPAHSPPAIVKPASPAAAPSFFRPASRPAAQAATSTRDKAETVPELATKPLPVTLHGLAAGRGKPVQVFTSAVSGEIDLQVPRSTALPLRPVMVLAAPPAKEAAAKEAAAKPTKEEVRKPAERTVTIQPDSRRRQDARFNNGKAPQPQPEKIEPQKKVAVAAAVQEPEQAQPQPVQKQPVQTQPIRTQPVKPEPVKSQPAPAPAPQPVKETPVKETPKEKLPEPLARSYRPTDLDLPSLTVDAGGSFWSKLPVLGKAGVGLAAALAIGGVLFALSHGTDTKAASTAPQIVEGPALSAVDAGWITDWGAEPGVRREHDISVLRPSLNLTDYRLSFEAQIETKALGWIYRAQDGKNYYVNKLEIVKPGLTPAIAMVRFAVINGQEQPRTQTPLNLSVHLDTLYRIRFDAVGDRFSTYVQDQKIDEWTDDRLKMGGVGLYNERGERSSLKGTVNVVPLVIKR